MKLYIHLTKWNYIFSLGRMMSHHKVLRTKQIMWLRTYKALDEGRAQGNYILKNSCMIDKQGWKHFFHIIVALTSSSFSKNLCMIDEFNYLEDKLGKHFNVNQFDQKQIFLHEISLCFLQLLLFWTNLHILDSSTCPI